MPSCKSSSPVARNRVTVPMASLFGIGGKRHWLLPNMLIMEGELVDGVWFGSDWDCAKGVSIRIKHT